MAEWDRQPGVKPRVSIIVPARNEEACLGDCLASLAAQTYADPRGRMFYARLKYAFK